jgi:hypothetical protein
MPEILTETGLLESACVESSRYAAGLHGQPWRRWRPSAAPTYQQIYFKKILRINSPAVFENRST